MSGLLAPAWEQEIVRLKTCVLDPTVERLAREVGDLEANRTLCFVSKNHRALGDLITSHDIAHAQRHEVTCTQFAVNREIEHGQVS